MPTVSVIIPSYNHRPFIAKAIESVLNQSYPDFELLVEDDGSTDNTEEVLKSFNDERFSYKINKSNSGAGIVTKNLIDKSKGKYIALLNSDDYWNSDKLYKQVNFLNNNKDVAACFTRVNYINQNDEHIAPSSLTFGEVFNESNRSRGQWLRHFLYKGNCLCNPSVMIHAYILKDIGVYKNTLRQLPDFELWTRLLKGHDIYVLEEALVHFRILSHGANASSESDLNRGRILSEYMLIYERFFDDVDKSTLIHGFGDLLIIPEMPSFRHENIERAFLYFQPAIAGLEPILKIIGYKKLYEMMNDPQHRTILHHDYNFTDSSFHELGKCGDIFLAKPMHLPPLYKMASKIYRRLFPRP